MSYQPIEHVGIIGNMRTALLEAIIRAALPQTE